MRRENGRHNDKEQEKERQRLNEKKKRVDVRPQQMDCVTS